MNTTTKRTPGPWLLDGDHGYGNLNGTRIRDEKRGYVLSVAIGDVPELNAPANAEFIVRACNAHDDLVAALKEAQKLAKLMEDLCGCRGDDEYVWGVQKKIDAAISKAGVQS